MKLTDEVLIQLMLIFIIRVFKFFRFYFYIVIRVVV